MGGCEFSATPMAPTHIFLGNSSDDIKPGGNPIALYQSQQVEIIQRGARRWAQIFAQAGKQGSWVGAWERAPERPRAPGRSNKHNSLLQQRGHLLKSDTPLRQMESLCL